MGTYPFALQGGGVQLSGDLGGTDETPQVTGITGRPVSAGQAWQALAGSHSAHAQRWQAGLAARPYLPVVVSCIGDSFTSGNEAGLTWEQTWPIMLQQRLNGRYPVAGINDHGRGMLAPVLIGEVSADYVVVTGTPTKVYNYGFNGATYDISAGGGCTLTYSLVGDNFAIIYASQPSGGSFTWEINSEGANTVSTAAGAIADGQVVFTASGFDPGVGYTLTITHTAAGPVWIDAVIEFNGDLGGGIQVYNCGASGSTSGFWTGQDWAVQGSNATPQLIVIELGGNDWQSGVTPAAFQANLTAIMTALRAATTGDGLGSPSFLLLTAVGQTPAEPYPWSDYVNAMYAIAAAADDVDVLDLTLRMPANYADLPDAGLYDPSSAELTATGHSLVADILLNFIGPQ